MLQEHLNKFCIAYLDDIVVYSNSLKKHREHVLLVFAKLQEAGLYLKLSKYEFEMQHVSFVDFIDTPEGVQIELERVRTIAKWSEPASLCNIKVFLGFVNFYRHFISSFSHIAKLMIDMLNRGKNCLFWGLSYLFQPRSGHLQSSMTPSQRLWCLR